MLLQRPKEVLPHLLDKVSIEDFIKLKDCSSFGHDSYKIWQRQETRSHTPAIDDKSKLQSKRRAGKAPVNAAAVSKSSGRSVSSPFEMTVKQPPVPMTNKTCSSLCRHVPKFTLPKIRDAGRKRFDQAERNIVKSQIASKTKAIQRYTLLCHELSEHNAELKDSICRMEKNTHDAVTICLDQYRRCKTLSKVIHSDHHEDVDDAEEDYHDLVTKTKKETDDLQMKTDRLCKVVMERKKEVDMLTYHKENIYSSKEIEIKEHIMIIDKLASYFKDELHRLDEISTVETQKYHEHADLLRKTLMTQMSKDAVDDVSTTIVQQALENQDMEKSIELFISEQSKLEKHITELEMDIKQRKEIKFRNVAFPDVLMNRDVCWPGDEIHLRDVSTIEVLPF